MNPHVQVLIVSIGALTLAVLVGGSIVITGVVIGLVFFAAIWSLFTFVKPFRALVNWNPLLGDICVSVLVWFMVPAKGITAIMAISTCAILFTITIRLRKWAEHQQFVKSFLQEVIKEEKEDGAYQKAKGKENPA